VVSVWLSFRNSGSFESKLEIGNEGRVVPRKENVINESLLPERQTRLYIVMLFIMVTPPLHTATAFVSLMWKGA
jgi:hypothetical protein